MHIAIILNIYSRCILHRLVLPERRRQKNQCLSIWFSESYWHVMPASKADVIAQLQRDILPLQGFKAIPGNMGMPVGLGPVKKAFLNHEFPLGAVHECISTNTENLAAGKAFISSIMAALMKEGSAAVWIGNTKNVFPLLWL